jgi:rubrerythrin
MGTWRCTKCGNTSTGNSKPLAGICRTGGGHRWSAENNATRSVWRCGKCGNTTVSANRPLDRACMKGGKCTWSRQG